MKVLPRYPFKPPSKPVGCAAHDSINCLCDVVVTNPVEIRTDIPHKFWDVALAELDDDTVSERNVFEFFQIVMAMEKLERVLQFQSDPTNLPPDSPWSWLDGQTRANVSLHAKADSPWSIAKIELEGTGVDPDKFKLTYQRSAGTHRDRDRKRGDVVPRTFEDRQAVVDKRNARRRDRERERMQTDPEYRERVLARGRAWRKRTNGKVSPTWIDQGNGFLYPPRVEK